MSDRDHESPPAVELHVLDHLRVDSRLIRVRGPFDGQMAAELHFMVALELLALEIDILVLDVRDLTEFSAVDARTILRIADDLAAADVGLSLLGPNSLVEGALDRAGGCSLFEMHTTVDGALGVA